MIKENNFVKYVSPKPIKIQNRKWPDQVITHAPRWCSVDLRDGNQALPVPMNPDTKLEFFLMLVKIGFKEIEVGFPSASQDDFNFVRRLIEEHHIPDDVTISVLTQARQHLIDRTVEALAGCHRALLHCYVATSDLHGKIVFGKAPQDVLKMSVEGTKMCKEALQKANLLDKVSYEFSPEEFTDTDLDFVLSVCHAVRETWGETTKENFILNLPATVERRPPNQYADMIEYFCQHYRYLDTTMISLHAHNDQGCAVAATELALSAGGERVEGTLLGHGERTGNVDIITLALNLESRGVDPQLDFHDLPNIVRMVESASHIAVHPRHPYAGQLVFTAFSGSHQDAIRKGLDSREKVYQIFGQSWKVPYLHIDPSDVGRVYEKLIRINSQSGKGGIAFVLESEWGIHPPKSMHPEIGHVVQSITDVTGEEMTSDKLIQIFRKTFVNIETPFLFLDFNQETQYVNDEKMVNMKIKAVLSGQNIELSGLGNGPISASVAALKSAPFVPEFEFEDFSEQTTGKGSDAVALAFISIRKKSDQQLFYGAGEHENIGRAAIKALFSAINRAFPNLEIKK